MSTKEAKKKKKSSVKKYKPKKSSHKSKTIPPLNWLLPVKKKVKGVVHYLWPYFTIEPIKNKGNTEGLVANENLPANTQFIYYGQRINERDYRKLVREGKANYVADCPGELKCLVDANPEHEPDENGVGGHGKFIGGKVNEPALGETENAWLTEIVDKDGTRWPGLVLVKPVKKGKEILTHYGPDYKRTYKVGKAVKNEPWWFSL